MKQVLMLMMLVGMGFGQDEGAPLRREWPIKVSVIPKHCAFDLKPQPRWSAPSHPKPAIPTVKQEFDHSLGIDPSSVTSAQFTINPAIWELPIARLSCPYERAIELFGEDRVAFQEVGDSKGGAKIVFVDGEEVYREPSVTGDVQFKFQTMPR